MKKKTKHTKTIKNNSIRRSIGEIAIHGACTPQEQSRLDSYMKKLDEFYRGYFSPEYHKSLVHAAVNASLIELRLSRSDFRYAIQSQCKPKLETIAANANELIRSNSPKLKNKPTNPQFESVSYQPTIGYDGAETVFVNCRDCKKTTKIRTRNMGKTAPPRCRLCGGILELKYSNAPRKHPK
jgi:hypothetical protein